ncbi:MAG TPA: hypothetical protein VK923_16450 [Euzebyales bacterium]|nr:hypothetical protein [Euzebyales bacterium]
MRVRMRSLIAGLVVVVATVGGGGAAIALSDDVDRPIVGAALEQATTAALAHTGRGRVTGTEVGDEDSYYEVEVTTSDGTQVDVQLDERFNVVGDMADIEDDSAGR